MIIKYDRAAWGSTIRASLVFATYQWSVQFQKVSFATRLLDDNTCLVVWSPWAHYPRKWTQGLPVIITGSKPASLYPDKSIYRIVPKTNKKNIQNLRIFNYTWYTLFQPSFTPISSSAYWSPVKLSGTRPEPARKNFKIYWQHFQSKLNYFLPVSTLLKLYHTFVHPQLLSRFIIWGSTYPTKIFPFVKTKLLDSSVEVFTTDHATPFNLANQILKLPDLLKHKVAKVVFRHLKTTFLF